MRSSQFGHGTSSGRPPKTWSPIMENTIQNSTSSTTMEAKDAIDDISTCAAAIKTNEYLEALLR